VMYFAAFDINSWSTYLFDPFWTLFGILTNQWCRLVSS